MDRRTSIKWVLAAGSSLALLRAHGGEPMLALKGYGTDPDLLKTYHPGDLWPLTLSTPQRQLASVLSDLIIPADEHSPSASAVGVVDFIDEWVSAPYPAQQRDRPIVLEGFAWLEAEGGRRAGKGFAELDAATQSAICDSICAAERAAPELREAAHFFALYRD